MKTKMEKVNAASPDERTLERAAGLIMKGEVVVCPTDSGYAFSANALDTRAIAKVFYLKGRASSNPVHVAVHSVEEAEKYAHLNDAARYLADHYLPGALTLVLPKKDTIPVALVAGLDTVGIRIPDNRVIQRLAEITGKPLTATSANISGRPATYSIDEVTAQLGENLELVAMVLDQGPLKVREVSTIVDLSVTPPQLIRQGRISWLEVRETLMMFEKSKEKKPE
ncbi:MAG: threonylcarbamoyl-AMP synthase [Dehalococcoidales bacterium]|nr:threonylcarbamoyl-AMP synthase [Dehalococcoidales bacterium]